jgi:hypothetical protein
MPSSGMWRRVGLVTTYVPEEYVASIFRVGRIRYNNSSIFPMLLRVFLVCAANRQAWTRQLNRVTFTRMYFSPVLFGQLLPQSMMERFANRISPDSSYYYQKLASNSVPRFAHSRIKTA